MAPSTAEAPEARPAPTDDPQFPEILYPRPPADVPQAGLSRVDDREGLQPSDRTLLIIEDDVSFARILLDAAHEKGWKGLIASLGEAGLAMATKLKPSAIILDLRLPDLEGWTVLDRLKHDAATRHIPVVLISAEDQRQHGRRLGALGFLLKPASHEGVMATIGGLLDFAAQPERKLLLVEDDPIERATLLDLIGTTDVTATAVATGKEALAALEEERFHCMVLDLGLPDTSGVELLRKMRRLPDCRELPIIVYTGRELARKEEAQLKRLAQTIILKDVRSPERLLDETVLFLHRVESTLPPQQRQALQELHHSDPLLAGKKVLVVDDDVRNIFAVTSALECHQAVVIYAENGADGLALLEQTPDVDVVLMDIMMPEMDGYEVMRRIRALHQFHSLPIIALTAKAMRDDREKCIRAGASDYVAKPVDIERLLSIMRVWLA